MIVYADKRPCKTGNSKLYPTDYLKFSSYTTSLMKKIKKLNIN